MKKYTRDELNKKTITTSDAIKSSFSDVYKMLEQEKVAFLTNQRNDDLVISKASNAIDLDALLSYNKNNAFDGVVSNTEENIFLARKFIKENTYLMMMFESNNVTFPDIEYIQNNIKNKKIEGYDFEKEVTIDLMNAWKYVLANYNSIDLKTYKKINWFVSKNQSLDPGVLRSGNTSVSGTEFKPSIPNEELIIEKIEAINKSDNIYDAISKFIPYAIKNQFFWDGNKRSVILMSNLILINNGMGIVSIQKADFEKFNTLLNNYYNDEEKHNEIADFILKKCFYNTTDKKFIIKNKSNL